MSPRASSSSARWRRTCCAGARPEMAEHTATAMIGLRRTLLHRVTLTFALVAVVWAVAGQALPGFAAFGHLRYMVELASIMGIAAAGQTLVVIGAGIDLSVAGIITFTAIIMPLVSPAWDESGLVGVVVTLSMAL